MIWRIMQVDEGVMGPGGGGGVLDISFGGKVRLGPSYPDPV